jgi:hypothetical protein
MTFQNTDVSSWDNLHVRLYFDHKNINLVILTDLQVSSPPENDKMIFVLS